VTVDTQSTFSSNGCQGSSARCGDASFCRNPFSECVAGPAGARAPAVKESQEQQLPRETCIFLDWDDTLLATSFINTVPDGEMTPMEEMQLQSLGRSVASLLKLARRLGRVWIITNAGEGWVEQSTSAFLPFVAASLEKIPVVSARSRFEVEFPDDAFMWKRSAFLDVLQRLDLGEGANLISIGDSLCEMLALKAMGEELNQPSLKTVQFVQSPTLEELQQQQQCLIGALEKIVDSDEDLDIEMSRCDAQGRFTLAQSQQ